MSPKWRRRITVAAFIVLIGVALNAMLNFSFSEIRLEHERHYRVASDVRALDCHLDSYKTRNGSLPSALGALGDVPKDPWEKNYIYRHPGLRHRDGYDLFSAGPDRTADTPDDDWGE